MKNLETRLLRAWLVISFVAIGWLLYRDLTGGHRGFDVIDAERINIRDKNGTLRIAIANNERQDVGNIDGLPVHEPGTRPAGMIFFNEHGDEMGGLIFKGVSAEDVGASFTFDRWKNDQTLQLLYADSKGKNISGMKVSDRPNDDTLANLIRRQHEIKKLQGERKAAAEQSLLDDLKSKKINLGTARVFAGVENGIAQYSLYDGSGKLKVRISADPEGPGKIELFDKDGKPVSR